MITTENFIGQPNEKTLYPTTLERFRQRMAAYPNVAVTDLGYRSAKNRKLRWEDIDYVFMGKSADVDATHQEACRSARSATEGFIAVAKNLRGFGQSLYRGLVGATIWSRLNQCAYNLKKFLQLYRDQALSEETRMKLRLSSIAPVSSLGSVDVARSTRSSGQTTPPVRHQIGRQRGGLYRLWFWPLNASPFYPI